MRVARDELLATVTAGNTGDASLTVLMDPVRSAAYFPWLAGLATSWERIVWHRMQVTWRPAVGATTDGMVAYAPDFNNPATSTSSPKRPTVVSSTPVRDHAIWQSTEATPLVVPPAMLRSRAQFTLGASDGNDAAPCSLTLALTGGPPNKMVGELWVRYDVTLSGPRKAGT